MIILSTSYFFYDLKNEMPKVFVSGSIAYDHVMQFNDHFANHILPEQIDKLSVSFVVPYMEKFDGGTAHNISYNLGLLGMKDETIMMWAVGKDFEIKEKLSKKINYEYIHKDEELMTAAAYVITDNKNNQITPFYPGALVNANKQNINGIEDSIDYAIISPNEKTAMLKHIMEIKNKSKDTLIFFAPGQMMTIFNKEELLEAAHHSNYLVCNEYEIELFCNITGLTEDEAVKLFDKIVVTLGDQWVSLRDHTSEHHIHSVPVDDVKDPTGAGDAFVAGLVAGLYKWKGWLDSLKIANIVASYAVQSHGTLNHEFTKTEIEKKFEEVYEAKITL